MCFTIDVIPTKWPLPSGAIALSADALTVETGKDRLRITEEGGCACSLLADDADWTVAVWSLRTEALEPLSRTILELAEQFPAGFAVQPTWVGDPIRQDLAMSAGALAEAIRTNQLRNWTRYLVDRNTV